MPMAMLHFSVVAIDASIPVPGIPVPVGLYDWPVRTFGSYFYFYGTDKDSIYRNGKCK